MEAFRGSEGAGGKRAREEEGDDVLAEESNELEDVYKLIEENDLIREIKKERKEERQVEVLTRMLKEGMEGETEEDTEERFWLPIR